MENSIFVEPEATFAERSADVVDDVFAFTQADTHIFTLLRSGPMPLTTVLNVTARLLPSRSKRQKLAVKHSVLLRLGELIRQGNLKRIKRKFVALPKV